MFLPTVNPEDPDNVFLRCDMTGAYVTHDGGQSWRMFHLRAVVRDFEFDPRNPSTIYAANTGLYRSEDRGLHWSLVYPAPENVIAERMVGDHAEQGFETVNGMPGGEIVKVRVHPTDSDRIYLGFIPPFTYSAASAPEQEQDLSPLLVSFDRGATWRRLASVKGRRIYDIIPGCWDARPDEVTVVTDQAVARISEKTGEITYFPGPAGYIAHAETGRGPQGSIIYAMTSPNPVRGWLPSGDGVYLSRDRGESWTRIMDGLLDDVPLCGKAPVFSTIGVCEGDAEVAYLSCNRYYAGAGGKRLFGIFKTVDAGARWSWVFRADNESMLSGNYDGGWLMEEYGPEWGENPFSLGVCPTNPEICYASDFGATHRTKDGGATWEQVYTEKLPDGSYRSRGLDVTVCYGVRFDPFDKNHLFANYTDIGAFQSFNGGESWYHATAGIPHSWINGCYWTVFDPQVRGRAWSVWSSAHDLPRPKMMRSGNLDRYVGGVAVSVDGCRNWSLSSKGLPENCVCTHLILDPASPVDSRTLYVCGFGKGVFKSVDGGRTWKKAGEIPGKNKNAWRLALLPDGKMFLLVARGLENRQTVDGALYTSNDSGGSWQPVALPEGVNAPNDLAVDPTNPERMFLCLWPWPKEGREVCGGVLLTGDSGLTWQRVFREDAHVFAADIDPSDPDKVYINTFDSAAFGSADGGKTWSKIKGYAFKWGHRPVVDPHNPGMLYLSTFGGGLFHGPAAGDPENREDILDFPDKWRWGDRPF